MLSSLLLAALEVVAVYYPHWHPYPKGTEWFGPSWSEGEWTFVKNAKTRWPGQHNLKPLPGYLNGKDPADVATEIDLASGNGIDVFLYDYYYYGGKITQQEAIEEGFLKAPNRGKMKFALMWCYHERRDAFRIGIDSPDRFLMKLDHTPEEFLGLIDYSIAHYFNQPEYWRKDGRLFFSIYNAKDFIKSLGPAAAKKAIADARAKIRAAGLGEVNFNAQNVPADQAGAAKEAGFDSLTDYGFNAYNVRTKRPKDWLFDYAEADGPLQARWASHRAHDLPYYPVVPSGWDSTLRCRLEEPFPWKKLNYPYGPSFTNVNPVVFEKYLRDAKRYVEEDPKKGGVVYLNAWNEYTEGCYLLPTVRTGDQMLRAIGRVFGRRPAGTITSCRMKHWWDAKAKNGTAFTVPAPTFENLKYGPHARQSLDVWLPPKTAAAKTPCLVVIHGGGWMDGDRLGDVGGVLPKCREKGVALVAISYRMVPDGNDAGVKPPVKVCLDDAVAAVEYVKAHAAEWNVDVTRIGLTGGSAGACSSLYAALQDDCALGIRAVLAQSPQTSLDPQEMKAWIPNSNYGAHAFGAGDFANWLAHRADYLPWIERFSPAALLRRCTAAKAPLVLYTCPAVPPKGELPKDPTHAGMFCVKFREICEAKGVACRRGSVDELLAALRAGEAAAVARPTAPRADPVRIIFDTDMLTDFDDVGALACLHALADAGECEILATVTCTRGNASVGAVEVINGYYGRGDLPVGCAKELGVLGPHAGAKAKVDPKSPLGTRGGGDGGHYKYRKLCADYPQWVRHVDSDDAPDANGVYRRALASAPDGSVVICSVGFLTNLRRLLETKPDGISPLDGKALVAKKVKKWVAMACSYPRGQEYNSRWDAESSRIVLENWPTPVVFSDWQYGGDVFAGRAVAERDMPRNPVRDVFAGNIPSRDEVRRDPVKWMRSCFGMGGRAAWDETAVLAAVRGETSYFNVHRGTYRMVGDTGDDEWVPDEEHGRHVRITEKLNKCDVARIIDELICRKPRH